MRNWIKNNWGKILILTPILAILIGCGRVAFVFSYGSPLRLEASDFTVEDPKNQDEIAYTFIESIAFHKIEGIKPFVVESKRDDLIKLVNQIEPATNRCRHPFDLVLLGPGSSYKQNLEQKISIQYQCPVEGELMNYRTYFLTATIFFEKDANGHLRIIRWCGVRAWHNEDIGSKCS
ncbi:MAG: hypothetical protein AB8G95_30995 [Anaerolineae bacterium]